MAFSGVLAREANLHDQLVRPFVSQRAAKSRDHSCIFERGAIKASDY
jgi:hypothetical protein